MRFHFALLSPFFLFAAKAPHFEPVDDAYQAWLTGPLLAPSSLVIPIGDLNVEPYIYAIANTGFYNSDWKAEKNDTLWVNNIQPFFQAGLTEWMDFSLFLNGFYNYSDHQAKWNFGDIQFGIDIQLFHPPQKSWAPNLKLALRENFPVGKYRNLDPKKKGTDIGGIGSFASSVGIVLGKLIHFGGVHFMSTRLFLDYTLPAAVNLKGFNLYGGGYKTNARFFPAQNFQADLGIEVTLTQNWALACDFLGSWSGKTHFSGDPGIALGGGPATLGTGSAVQYSIAPAFEYNWNSQIGIIAGSWFTVAGRNSVQFSSFVAAFNYYN